MLSIIYCMLIQVYEKYTRYRRRILDVIKEEFPVVIMKDTETEEWGKWHRRIDR